MSSDKPTITEIPVVVKNPNGVDQIIITAGIKIPHGYYAIVWGQRIATNPQRFNAYILDENKIVISDPSQDGLSLKWDASAPAHLEQFKVTQAYPPTVPPDPRVFFFGPYKKTRYVGISCFHSDDDGKTFKQSKIKEQFRIFDNPSTQPPKGHNPMYATMVHAQGGGEGECKDTLIGVAVTA